MTSIVVAELVGTETGRLYSESQVSVPKKVYIKLLVFYKSIYIVP